jgi:hypothetical protein
MSVGQGNISFSEPPGSGGGGGGTVTAANNGLSLNGTTVVLGNDVGQSGDPAQFLSERQINMQGVGLQFLSGGLNTAFLRIGGEAASGILQLFKGATGQEPLQLKTIQGTTPPPGINAGDFWWTLDEGFTNTDGQIDAVWQWGYNQNGAGGRVNNAEAAIWWSMESAFENIPSDQFEIELQSISKDGNSRRHLQLDVNKEDGVAEGTWTAGSWEWFNDNSTDPYMTVTGPSAVLALIGTGTGGPSILLQNNNPASGQLSIETNTDGSVNISNDTTGSNPQIVFGSNLTVNAPDIPLPGITVNVFNQDNAFGYRASGTVSAGSGTAWAFHSNIAASGALLAAVENQGTGSAGFLAQVVAGAGNGNPDMGFQISTGQTWVIGMDQSDDLKFKIDFGTSFASPAMVLTQSGQVGIANPSPDPSAILDVASTTLGVLFPRMTTTQKNAIAAPAEGLLVYDLTLHSYFFWNGTAWTAV